MNALLIRYEGYDPLLRLVLAMGVAVILNALYCLAYTYSAGHPETLTEAFWWGVINIAPWIAAVELGRQVTRKLMVGLVILAAAAISLALGAMIGGELPDGFAIIRRIPGAAATIAVLAVLELWRSHRVSQQAAATTATAESLSCDWARAAGNYVELHARGRKPRLVRTTLASLVDETDASLLRVHRSFAVAPDHIARVERAHVRLRDGTRIPIGNAFRAPLDAL
ncbi:LytTR family DNA-binding domain-containing protein [Altererythrobacter arenosus]|uniref:LytTR family DNA-binding domain-containing protein n=1 Tax=Altererythrobacter arenosus TaxID=3032592 RepID=A0ABY8FVM3_9SPHN|nr:LytTR family DNA-binding domain-containing protein [Altererythrobacter sp. CAU 1644]WFL78887.1 LytTR family DNA-binding domain-containing protein [Altererythrobacter sp. CAU 1644]